MSEVARLRRPTRPQAAIGVVVAVVVVISGLLVQGDFAARPSGSPGASASPGAASPGQTAAPWAGLELPPLERVASLEPSSSDAAGVAPDSAFTLTSLTGESATALAGRLEVAPPVELAAAPSGANAARLSPATALEPNRVYRFTLRSPDGSIAGSWAYRVRGPVAVTSTLPGDATEGVPVRTGIEVTFNQEGVADMAAFFSISPAVTGRFERRGRTQVFVPDALTEATLYTVTISAGLGRPGTELALASDYVFRFETEGPTEVTPSLSFVRDVLEASPAEAPVAALVRPFENEPSSTARAVEVTVYRLPSLDAAATALAAFIGQPRWTVYTNPLMPTDGLAVAATFSAALEEFRADLFVVRFPEALDPGSYIVEIEAPRRAQAFLQVTPVSAWVSVLNDRTVVWVNDVTTGRALRDAAVSLGAGPAFAHSGADGLAIGPTPAELVPPATLGLDAPNAPAPILRVRSATGATVLVPFGVASGDGYRGEWSEKSASANETYWSLLYTDRGVYRSDDRIAVWGYLRDRDDGSVPPAVEVRLTISGTERSAEGPSVVTATARPGPTGAFTAVLSFVDVPAGWYEVQAVVDGEVVVSRWAEVTVIRKPPYELTLTPDHTAVIAGSAIRWTVNAAFFDGTPAASVPLTVSSEAGSDRAVTTDAGGNATLRLTAQANRNAAPDDDPWESPTSWYVEAHPSGPEGADISASTSITVFPSSWDLAASGVVVGGEIRVTGSLHLVDLAKVERALADGTWDGDAAGAAVPGTKIQAAITELIPVRRQVGTEYDFIEKIVRPIYEYDTQEKALATLTVTSGADGGFALARAVPDPTHLYRVVLMATDDAGRLVIRTLYAGTDVGVPWWADAGPVFETADGGLAGEARFGIGDEVSWRIVDGDQAFPSGGADRYLYLTAQRGLRSAVVTDAATFEHAFAATDAPGIFVIGVRFTGTTYAPKAAAWASFEPAERSIKVAITADRERYRPGEDVTLSVVTTDATGRPVPANVVLQGVDEKLYAIGGASVPTPLEDLYARVDSGIVRLTATHQVPTSAGIEGEGGDTTGGGARSDFRDTLFFIELQTDAAGHATTTARLSDDLTSWHVTGAAVTASLEAGVGELLVPVGLPFFVEATVADGYLVSDHPAIQLRAFGDALVAGDPVEFTVASAGLGLPATRVTGTAFTPTRFTLPALVAGNVSIDVAATAPTRLDAAGKPLADRLLRTFEVVATRLTGARSAYGTLADPPSLPGAAGIVTYTFSDAGRGRYLPLLLDLAQPSGARLDRALAQSIARRLLIEDFGRDPATIPPLAVDLSAYPGGSDEYGSPNETAGLPLLPYGGMDPWLAVRAAIVAPDAWDQQQTRETLRRILDLPSTARDLAIATFASLAAVGDPVLPDLVELNGLTDLTPVERLYLALGFEAVGDDTTALAIERDLLATYGERLGTWTRLRVGDSLAEIVEATSLAALLAAGVGDPTANGLADYVRANPSKETTHALDLAGYAGRMLARTPASRASFAYTVDGVRHVVNLEPGDASVVRLTSAQAATLRLARISGQVGVVVEARVPVAASALEPSADLTLKRTGPTGTIPAGGIVVVNLTATFTAAAPENGCYEVVETVPSGLAPLDVTRLEDATPSVTYPSSVVGQEVRFCAGNDARSGHTASLRYLARVVNEGTFTWEPAVMQLAGAPEALAFTPPVSVVVGQP